MSGSFRLSEFQAPELTLLRTLVGLALRQQGAPSLAAHSTMRYPFFRLFCSWIDLDRAFNGTSTGLTSLLTTQNVLRKLSSRALMGGENYDQDCGPVVVVQRIYEDPAATRLRYLQIDISALAKEL